MAPIHISRPAPLACSSQAVPSIRLIQAACTASARILHALRYHVPPPPESSAQAPRGFGSLHALGESQGLGEVVKEVAEDVDELHDIVVGVLESFLGAAWDLTVKNEKAGVVSWVERGY